MAKGSAPAPTQSTTYEPNPQQREILKLAMPGVREWAATVPKRYEGATVAGFDPAQTQGQEMALGAAGGAQQQLADAATSNATFMQGDIWNPASNPNLQGAVDAAVRPVTQRYQEVARPAVRDEFQAAGQQFGGSRRNVAEGNLARDYLNTVSDTGAKVVQDQYANNLGASLKALALTPQTQQAAIAPALTTSGVGDVRQSLAQMLLNSDVAGFNYDQMAPFLQSKELMSLLQGIPGSTVTSTGSVPPQQSTGMKALGGAMSGASMGSAFGPPGMAIGGGLGALMGFL